MRELTDRARDECETARIEALNESSLHDPDEWTDRAEAMADPLPPGRPLNLPEFTGQRWGSQEVTW